MKDVMTVMAMKKSAKAEEAPKVKEAMKTEEVMEEEEMKVLKTEEVV